MRQVPLFCAKSVTSLQVTFFWQSKERKMEIAIKFGLLVLAVVVGTKLMVLGTEHDWPLLNQYGGINS
jgi:hypothetical protein